MVVFDTNMITERKQKILTLLKNSENMSSSEIHTQLNDTVALVTVKRELAELLALGYIQPVGGGRSVRYILEPHGRIFLPIDTHSYITVEPDIREGVLETYMFDIWDSVPNTLFSVPELSALERATRDYQEKSSTSSLASHKKELERFVIEMSWKSSRIEGNTYTLLDTELLLSEGIVSKKNTKEETQMILNHKKAFDFTIEQTQLFSNGISMSLIETVHTLLTNELLQEKGFRKSSVGVTGSRYMPLDNHYQIKEATEKLIAKINSIQDPYSKALLTLVGISYVQPFVDGNKRTARLLANALLMSKKCAPLSYRNVNEVHYRESLLTFYEQLSIVSMKEIFIDQYLFATKTYSDISPKA